MQISDFLEYAMKIYRERQLRRRHIFSAKVFSSILRFLGWSAAFSGIMAMSVCPFCGRQGCAVGGASAGIIGLICGGLMQGGGKLKALFKRIIKTTT